ncbi:MAG: hypothetical protein HOU81_01615 [Hamadaea sp.]|uniref:hypothetical protein n=1 Tax=Hamadaea sp. TaxID=2024425 RepID=UPI0018199E5C|nr:hypothetical protein [Hamadaea sp.]NUR69497.1 hypothetical protein [Hamadaea sp.]NUT20733.1 hypothetical protein [Hamadaea sp.]
MLVLLALSAGYVAGRRSPDLGGSVRRWIRRRPAPSAPTRAWRGRSRLAVVAVAFLATAPVWPLIQPGRMGDELLELAEVAVLVPIVLLFPIAWSLLGGSLPYARRIALLLAASVAGWSLWTVTFGTYASPPTVDDGLRWHLLGTGVVVVAATVYEARWRGIQNSRRWLAGVVVGMAGLAVAVVVPVVGAVRTPPPADAILPLPAAMTIVQEEVGCGLPEPGGFGPYTCSRRYTVRAPSALSSQEMMRTLADHLRRAKGWPMESAGSGTFQFACRRVGWLNPYASCVELRVGQEPATVKIALSYDNVRDHVVY